ncbi:MATE family efflux transporter [Corynebacterium aquilae]|uniref:Multidrug transporter MatE n=1 Tax=Corynebacterium aquilae DSM 44791 TaxID=1431546 RepID=A0A1L7CGK4_9CORY|nr:MATE family efflux transporter [Corynebacterium aquilae]APT84955.1 multidrug transporter MatE [Corynebacterium aquilae DSM 44791]
MTNSEPSTTEALNPTAKDILALALPALGVLAATPLYLLLDTAVVGRLGAQALAGLAAGTTIQSVVTTQLTFLSYGTTARSARKYGSGDTQGAIAEGVQATFVAIAVGITLAAIIAIGAPTFTLWLADDTDVAAVATHWLRIASLGIPLMLCVMAGNGWLRGIQNTRLPLYFTLAGVIPSAILVPILVSHLGVVGSAWANLIGVAITATCFITYLARRHTGSWQPRLKVMGQQLILGRDLILRSLSFQVAFLSAAAVAGRFGAASLGAHQVLLQLWNFLTLTLDSLAIAAQALTGAALGGASAAAAKATGWKITRYSSLFSLAMAAILAAGYHVIPRIFTDDTSVLGIMSTVWPLLVAMVIVGGVVFALDGVLLGASDVAFLRTATIASVILGFLPGVWLALITDSGLIGVWCGLMAMMLIRLIACLWRFRSGNWMREGTSV